MEFIYHQHWKDIYGECEEELPEDMPEPKRQPPKITVYIDASHGQDLLAHRRVTEFFVLLYKIHPLDGFSRDRKLWKQALMVKTVCYKNYH